MKDLQKLRDESGQLWDRMKAVLDEARASESGQMTGEQQQTYLEMEKRLDAIHETIGIQERAQERERKMLAEVSDAERARDEADNRGGDPEAEYREAYWKAQFSGNGEHVRKVLEKHPEALRTYQVDSDTAGGYLVPPQFMMEVISDLDNEVFMRGISRSFQVNARAEVSWPRKTARASGATRTGEISTVTEDTNLAFGLLKLKPGTLTSYIKVSRDLIRSGAMSVEQIVREELNYDFSVTEEAEFMTGDGALEALGIFTPSANGISTSRDVTLANATTIVGDDFWDTYFNLKPGYRMNSTWALSTTAVKIARKLKDGNGEYIWENGIAGGVPPTICGRPYFESEYVPDTFTASNYVGLLGDFRWYYILDDMGLEIQRLNELNALTNEIGFVGRMGMDAAPAKEEAFSRMKLSA